jgi:hypothetical protein
MALELSPTSFEPYMNVLLRRLLRLHHSETAPISNTSFELL